MNERTGRANARVRCGGNFGGGLVWRELLGGTPRRTRGTRVLPSKVI